MSREGLEEPPSKRAKLDPASANETSSNPTPANDPESSISDHTTQPPVLVSSRQLDIFKEVSCGISEYVNPAANEVRATLKTRYTDFLVNEILPNGTVLHLSELGVPDSLRAQKARQPKADEAVDSNGQDNKSAEAPSESAKPDPTNIEDDIDTIERSENGDKASISEETIQKLTDYLNATAANSLVDLYQTILLNPRQKHTDYPTVRTPFTTDRTLRSEIHHYIRSVFSSKIDSSTDPDGTLVLTAAKPGLRSNTHNRQKKSARSSAAATGRLGWADRGGEFLHFTLYKENKDTMESISWLVKQMKLNAKVFQFAGTKDRRAVTVQRVSAHRIDVDRLVGAARTLRNASVGDFEYKPDGLELGDLDGNEFTITLRDCEVVGLDKGSVEERLVAVKTTLEKGMERLYETGYINYFGMQRFGTFETQTDVTGLHILKGDFKAACDSILEYTQENLPVEVPEETNGSAQPSTFVSEDQRRAKALDIYKKTGNLDRCLAALPRKYTAEQTVLRHLHRQPQDGFGALMAIHRNLRLIYIHAYQSLVWNHVVTERMRMSRLKVLEGDLVLVNEHKDKTALAAKSASSAEPSVDADGEVVIVPSGNDKSNSADDIYERARHLTAAEVESNVYTIYDIVMPLPGFDVEYPRNKSGDYYKEFMTERGGLDPYDMRRKQRDFSLSGGYRKILSRMRQGGNDGEQTGGHVEVYAYERDNEQFVKTDMEILQAKKVAKGDSENGVLNATPKPAGDADDVEMGDEAPPPSKVAAVLKFQLGSSQYATMALRELSRGGIMAHQPDRKGA